MSARVLRSEGLFARWICSKYGKIYEEDYK